MSLRPTAHATARITANAESMRRAILWWKRMWTRYAVAAKRISEERCSMSDSLFKCLFHQHDGDVAHDRIHAAALDALQSLLDDGLFAAELVAELVAHDRALRVRKGNELHLFLADRAG